MDYVDPSRASWPVSSSLTPFCLVLNFIWHWIFLICLFQLLHLYILLLLLSCRVQLNLSIWRGLLHQFLLSCFCETLQHLFCLTIDHLDIAWSVIMATSPSTMSHLQLNIWLDGTNYQEWSDSFELLSDSFELLSDSLDPPSLVDGTSPPLIAYGEVAYWVVVYLWAHDIISQSVAINIHRRCILFR